MTQTTPPLRNPAINIYSHDVMRLVGFYQRLGFRETFRTPRQGVPVHVELTLDHFTIGIASVDAAIADHGLKPRPRRTADRARLLDRRHRPRPRTPDRRRGPLVERR